MLRKCSVLRISAGATVAQHPTWYGLRRRIPLAPPATDERQATIGARNPGPSLRSDEPYASIACRAHMRGHPNETPYPALTGGRRTLLAPAAAVARRPDRSPDPERDARLPSSPARSF